MRKRSTLTVVCVLAFIVQVGSARETWREKCERLQEQNPLLVSEKRARHYEVMACKDGWEKVLLAVGKAERKLLWKGPARWTKGAIIVMHGGGGVKP